MGVAAVQLTTTPDKGHNRQTAARMIRAAAADRARFVVLPEMFRFLCGPKELPAAMEALDGPTMNWARGLARDLGTADLDFAAQQTLRSQLPCLVNRRPETYRWPEPG